MLDDQTFISIALRLGLADQGTIRELAASAQRAGRNLFDYAVRSRAVAEWPIIRAAAEEFGLDAVNLADERIPRDILNLVPFDDALRLQAMPFAELGQDPYKTLRIAMVDPMDFDAIDALGQWISAGMEPVLVGPADLESTLARLKGPNATQPSSSPDSVPLGRVALKPSSHSISPATFKSPINKTAAGGLNIRSRVLYEESPSASVAWSQKDAPIPPPPAPAAPAAPDNKDDIDDFFSSAASPAADSAAKAPAAYDDDLFGNPNVPFDAKTTDSTSTEGSTAPVSTGPGRPSQGFAKRGAAPALATDASAFETSPAGAASDEGFDLGSFDSDQLSGSAIELTDNTAGGSDFGSIDLGEDTTGGDSFGTIELMDDRFDSFGTDSAAEQKPDHAPIQLEPMSLDTDDDDSLQLESTAIDDGFQIESTSYDVGGAADDEAAGESSSIELAGMFSEDAGFEAAAIAEKPPAWSASASVVSSRGDQDDFFFDDEEDSEPSSDASPLFVRRQPTSSNPAVPSRAIPPPPPSASRSMATSMGPRAQSLKPGSLSRPFSPSASSPTSADESIQARREQSLSPSRSIVSREVGTDGEDFFPRVSGFVESGLKSLSEFDGEPAAATAPQVDSTYKALTDEQAEQLREQAAQSSQELILTLIDQLVSGGSLDLDSLLDALKNR